MAGLQDSHELTQAMEKLKENDKLIEEKEATNLDLQKKLEAKTEENDR